jgi:hypothetical protein
MTRFVEHKAGKQESTYGKAELPSAHADADDDAEEYQKPARAVHAERDFKSRHGSYPRWSY